jgi:NAD(P)H-flavin reductase
LKNDDGTQLSLVYGSRTVEDIILKDELDQLSAAYSKNFHLHYTVDVGPSYEWKYDSGFIT